MKASSHSQQNDPNLRSTCKLAVCQKFESLNLCRQFTGMKFTGICTCVCMIVSLQLFIYLIGVLQRTLEYFTCMAAASIRVRGKGAVSGGNPEPSAGCWRTFPLSAGAGIGLALTTTALAHSGVITLQKGAN